MNGQNPETNQPEVELSAAPRADESAPSVELAGAREVASSLSAAALAHLPSLPRKAGTMLTYVQTQLDTFEARTAGNWLGK